MGFYGLKIAIKTEIAAINQTIIKTKLFVFSFDLIILFIIIFD